MSRPVTLFTGQWADLPIEELAAKCGAWGFDGLELACWGDHFEVEKALSDGGYVGTGSACGRSAPTSWGRPCATGSTTATARPFHPTFTVTASRRVSARGQPSG